MNENENDFKYLTIALNDHGGYEESSPKIFENIPTFISGCKYVEQERDKVKTFLTSDKVKIFLSSDDLFFVYSVPHNCKHIETKEPTHVFTKLTNMPNFKNAQLLTSNMNVDACKKTIITNEKNIKKLINNHSIKILQELVIILTNFQNTKNLFIKTQDITNDIELIGIENKIITQDLFKEFKKLGTYIKQDNKPKNISMLKTILEEIQKIIDIIEKPVDKIYEQPLLKLKNELSNVLKGSIPYYEYIVSGKHSFYTREEFNDESNDYFLSPNIDLITTNIGEKKQSFIKVLEYVLQEKETNKENQQPNSVCSIEILRYFINKIKQGVQYSTSELLIVLYIIYEHYERNCFITVNANHCRTCINGGKPRSKTRRKPRRQTRRKIRRNKKAKTKKRKVNKKTKKRKMKRKTNMNRKKSKKRRTKK